jgi:putative transposase
VIFRFVQANQADFPVSVLCATLEVSRSGYYAWLHRDPSARDIEDAAIQAEIEEIHAMSRRSYGARRIRAEFRLGRGRRIGRERVGRLMKKAGLKTITRRRFVKTTQRDPSRSPAPDLVQRDFSANAPNRLWVGDITYIPTLAGFLFLAVIIDVFSRRVVGWSMATHMRSELVENALDMAVRQRGAEGVIHHSDQASQYTSFAFGQRCKAAGVDISMGGVGDCYDNALCESFFGSLECELLHVVRFDDPAQARATVFAWIEGWYNTRRRHSAIGYLAPIEFERATAPIRSPSTGSQAPPGPPCTTNPHSPLTSAPLL